jgi:hypothetical protein
MLWWNAPQIICYFRWDQTVPNKNTQHENAITIYEWKKMIRRIWLVSVGSINLVQLKYILNVLQNMTVKLYYF